MKVLHLISFYLPAYESGGPVESVHNLNKSLVKKGIDVTVFTTNLNGSKPLDVPLNEEQVLDGVKVFYFPFFVCKKWEYSLSFHKFLKRQIVNFDIVHADSIFRATSFLGGFYARKFNKPYIISPRGSLMKEPMRRKSPFKKAIYTALIEKRNLANAAAVHFTTEMEKQEYLEAGLPLKKDFVIPNAIDLRTSDVPSAKTSVVQRLNFCQKFGISPDKKIILFLSRLNWKKGLDTLIPAFAEVLKKEPRAILVLAGPDENSYKKEIELKIENCKLKIGKEVIFTGMLLGDEKIAVYESADIFVLPSYSESFGMAVIEAMAMELPVVITKNVGVSNEVERAGAGLVVEKDVKQVAEAILKILNNPDLAKKMGENGRKLVETEFSSEKVVRRWIEEYNEIIKNV